MGSGEHYCLRWNNHQSNLLGVFSQLLEDGSLVDVTLACAEEGHSIRAHKVVLSACSSYFQTLFVAHPARHPIVILKDVCFKELRTLVEFMYKGEVNVEYCQLSALLKTAESLKVKGLADMTNLSTERDREKDRDQDRDRDRESREKDKDRDRDRERDKEREQEREREREQRNREQDREQDRDRDRERDQDRDRRRERDQEKERDRHSQEREKSREWSRDREELKREDERSQVQHLLPRHRHSAPSPGVGRSSNGVNFMMDSPLTTDLLPSHHSMPPLGVLHPLPQPLPLTQHHHRLLNSSPDSPPRPPSHSRSASPPTSHKLRRKRVDSSCDGDDSCHDPGGAIDPGSPDDADAMAGSPMSTCSAEPNDMTMATNLSNSSSNNNNNNNNNNNGIPASLVGCSGCPPGVCGLPSGAGGPSPLSLVQPQACSSAASSRLASPLAMSSSPVPGPSGMPPVQQVPLSLKKEVDWDRADRDDKSTAGENSSDYSRHPPDSESQGLGGRVGGGSEGPTAADRDRDWDRCSSPPRLFQCMYCGVSFPHQSKLTRHILSHSLESLKFRDSLAMQQHPLQLLPAKLEPMNLMESHLASVSHFHDGPLLELDGVGGPATPNAVLCKFCGKSFPDVGTLITHLPAHTGDRPFKCEFCGKAFKLRHHMKDHCRVHTGERPFRCTLCGKTFSRSTILKAHEKTHYPKYVRKFLSPSSPVEAGEEAPQQ